MLVVLTWVTVVVVLMLVVVTLPVLIAVVVVLMPLVLTLVVLTEMVVPAQIFWPVAEGGGHWGISDGSQIFWQLRQDIHSVQYDIHWQ